MEWEKKRKKFIIFIHKWIAWRHKIDSKNVMCSLLNIFIMYNVHTQNVRAKKQNLMFIIRFKQSYIIWCAETLLNYANSHRIFFFSLTYDINYRKYVKYFPIIMFNPFFVHTFPQKPNWNFVYHFKKQHGWRQTKGMNEKVKEKVRNKRRSNEVYVLVYINKLPKLTYKQKLRLHSFVVDLMDKHKR